MSFHKNFAYLIDTFGHKHEVRFNVRFTPSVMINNGFNFRVTVILDCRTITRRAATYNEAFNLVIEAIKEGE